MSESIGPEPTWRCHVCNDTRPDSAISVFHRSILIANARSIARENIRYCNDRASCIEGAKRVSFMKPLYQCEDCDVFAKTQADADAHCDRDGHSLAMSYWSLTS